MFRTVHLSIIRSFHCTHTNGICHTGLLIACEQDQDGTGSVLILLASCNRNLYDIYHCCVYSENSWWWTEELSENVEFYSKNKFQKSVHLVGFSIRKQTSVRFNPSIPSHNNGYFPSQLVSIQRLNQIINPKTILSCWRLCLSNKIFNVT